LICFSPLRNNNLQNAFSGPTRHAVKFATARRIFEMRTIQLIALAVSFSSIPLMAQQVGASGGASGQQNVSASAGKTHVNDSGQANADSSLSGRHVQANSAADNSASVTGRPGSTSANGSLNSAKSANGLRSANSSTMGSARAREQMRPVNGELESKLDSHTSKVGDPVIVKTTQKMTTADGVEIPKGSRLEGHVISAQAHAKGHANSQLGIVFERAELRHGKSIPIHSMIESVAPPPSELAAGSTDDSIAGGGMVGGGPMMAGGGGRSMMRGGGLVGGGGGLVNGTSGGMARTTGNVGAGVVGQTMGGTVNSTVDSTGRVAGGTSGLVNSQVGGAVGTTGSLATHVTGFPGVMLSGDAMGATSGTLSAANKNIHLDSGTQMVLGIAAEK
jgi:hypothetical protein